MRGRRLFSTYATLLLAFLYLPILVLVVYSFNDSKINARWNGFTFDWYIELFQKEEVLRALFNSLTIAVTSTVVATILGTLAALALHRYRYKFEGAIKGLIYLPILVPEILMGLSLLILFSGIGFELNHLTVIIAHITFSISYVVIVVSTRLSAMGPELEDAANDLGATPWQTFRHITFPMIAPGVVAAALLTFTLSIDDFVISFFVSGPDSTTLPIYIYSLVKKGVSPEINALSTILIVVIIALMGGAQWLGSRGDTDSKKSNTHLPF
ncbi:MAG: ABC transporter permease [Bacilli bacterium]